MATTVVAAPARPIAPEMFVDITPAAVTAMWWTEGTLSVTFGADLTQVQIDAVVRRIQSRNANEEEIRRLAIVALTTNAAYLVIATPTTVQAVAQTKALTRQVNGLIRMVLGVLDGTE